MMPGSISLPAGSEPIAAIVLTYSAIGWLCSATMIWLTWINGQRLSYVGIIAYSTLLGTSMSIVQQSYDITHWEQLAIEAWELVSTLPDSPELATAQGAVGLDLILFYVQFYTYNVSALCIFFWACELLQTLYAVDQKPKLRKICRKINQAGRGIAVVLPLFTTLILRLTEVQASIISFLLVADLPLMLSLTLGGLMVILILVRYWQTQKKFTQWSQPETDTEAGLAYQSTISSKRHGIKKFGNKKGGIYDRWLMVRFFFSFLMLGVFNVTTVLFQLNALRDNHKDAILTAPDLSVERAQGTLLGFLPGVTPGIILFLVFGTTAGHREKLAQVLIPKRWRGQQDPRCTLSAAIESQVRLTNRGRPSTARKWPWDKPQISRIPSYTMSPRTANTSITMSSPKRQTSNGRSIDVMSMMTKDTMANLQKPLPPYPAAAYERTPARYSFETTPTTTHSMSTSLGNARMEQEVWNTSLQDPASRPTHIHHTRHGSNLEMRHNRYNSNESLSRMPVMQAYSPNYTRFERRGDMI